MAQVRHEVISRGGSLPVVAGPGESGTAVDLRPSLARWQPSAPRIPVKREYTLPELLSFSDRDFVEMAYRALLRRAPDQTGLEDNLRLLRNGYASKVEILARLRWSAEGEKEGVHVDGLLAPYLLQKWRRKPVIGPVLGWLQAIVRLPSLFDRQSILDAAHARESQELGRTLNLQAGSVEQRLASLESDFSTALKVHAGQIEQRLSSIEGRIEQADNRLDAVAARLVATIERLEGLPDVVPAMRLIAARLDELAQAGGEQATVNHQVREAMEQGIEDMLKRDQGIRAELTAITATIGQLDRQSREEKEQAHKRDQGIRAELIAISGAVGQLDQQFRGNSESVSAEVRRLAGEVEPLLTQLRRAQEGRIEVDALLAAFEEAFHGDRSVVRSRFQPYVALLNNFGIGNLDAPVFDLASGRGEWLELLKELQLVAQGVDANRLFAELCQGRGLQVEAADAVDALAARVDGSVGAVTLMRNAGHMPLDRMTRLLDQSVRVLRPGGLVMLHGFHSSTPYLGMSGETGYHPPIPAETVRWLLEARGFYAARIAIPGPAAATTRHYDGSVVEGIELVKAPPAGTIDSLECAVIARKLL